MNIGLPSCREGWDISANILKNILQKYTGVNLFSE